MKHLKSYDEWLFEAKKSVKEDAAEDIEKNINKMGEVEDDEKEIEDKMKKSSEGPTTSKEGDTSRSNKDNKAKGSEKEELAKDMDKASKGPKEIELDQSADEEEEELEEVTEAANEKHKTYDKRLLSMTVNQVLDYLENADPAAYKAIETNLEKAFKDMTPQEAATFFTTMTA
jgi:uncharacterized protein with gpF-like domain